MRLIDALHIVTLVVLLIFIGTIIERENITPKYLGPILGGLMGVVIAYHGIPNSSTNNTGEIK